MIRHRIIAVDESSHLSDGLTGIRCALHAIPLPNHSLDAVVLHHRLETVVDPRSAIRELARVLVPGGRLGGVLLQPAQPLGLENALRAVVYRSFQRIEPDQPLPTRGLAYRTWFRVTGACSLPVIWTAFFRG